MNLTVERCLTLLGRILLSLIFILSGFGKIGDWSGTARSMATKGMVAVPFFLVMSILLELGGGCRLCSDSKRVWVAGRSCSI